MQDMLNAFVGYVVDYAPIGGAVVAGMSITIITPAARRYIQMMRIKRRLRNDQLKLQRDSRLDLLSNKITKLQASFQDTFVTMLELEERLGVIERGSSAFQSKLEEKIKTELTILSKRVAALDQKLGLNQNNQVISPLQPITPDKTIPPASVTSPELRATKDEKLTPEDQKRNFFDRLSDPIETTHEPTKIEPAPVPNAKTAFDRLREGMKDLPME